MTNKIFKWFGYSLMWAIGLFFFWLVSFHTLIPVFDEYSYWGDGDYDVTVGGPLMVTYVLSLPEFRLDEEGTHKFSIKRLSIPEGPSFYLWVESEKPVPFALLKTLVSIELKNSEGNLFYEINAPLDSHNKLCGMEEKEYREWQKTKEDLWFESACREEQTKDIKKSKTRYFTSGNYGDPKLSWWEDYELVLTVKNPDQSYGPIKAHLEIVDGPK